MNDMNEFRMPLVRNYWQRCLVIMICDSGGTVFVHYRPFLMEWWYQLDGSIIVHMFQCFGIHRLDNLIPSRLDQVPLVFLRCYGIIIIFPQRVFHLTASGAFREYESEYSPCLRSRKSWIDGMDSYRYSDTGTTIASATTMTSVLGENYRITVYVVPWYNCHRYTKSPNCTYNTVNPFIRYTHRVMSAIFDFSSLITVFVLSICTTTYLRELRPAIFDTSMAGGDASRTPSAVGSFQNDTTTTTNNNQPLPPQQRQQAHHHREGVMGFLWKLSRIGERCSPYISIACILQAMNILFWK